MSVSVTHSTTSPGTLRRARKNKWCCRCDQRIVAGSIYREVDAYHWEHLKCGRAA